MIFDNELHKQDSWHKKRHCPQTNERLLLRASYDSDRLALKQSSGYLIKTWQGMSL